ILSLIAVSSTFCFFFFFSSRRRHTRSKRDWSSDVCSSDLAYTEEMGEYGVGMLHERILAPGIARRVFLATDLVERGSTATPKQRSEERRVGKECRTRWWQE